MDTVYADFLLFKSRSESHWRYISKRTVDSLAVVEKFNVSVNLLMRLFLCPKPFAVNEFLLEDTMK
ncbi:hypothetical protein D3C86_1853750 [compost metagenome]